MKVEIVPNKKKKTKFIHIETRNYHRFITTGNRVPGYKLEDMKVYKHYKNLDEQFKMKRDNRWQIATNLTTREKFIITKIVGKSNEIRKKKAFSKKSLNYRSSKFYY